MRERVRQNQYKREGGQRERVCVCKVCETYRREGEVQLYFSTKAQRNFEAVCENTDRSREN